MLIRSLSKAPALAADIVWSTSQAYGLEIGNEEQRGTNPESHFDENFHETLLMQLLEEQCRTFNPYYSYTLTSRGIISLTYLVVLFRHHDPLPFLPIS